MNLSSSNFYWNFLRKQHSRRLINTYARNAVSSALHFEHMTHRNPSENKKSLLECVKQGFDHFLSKQSIRDGFLLFSPQQRIKLHLIVPIGARVKRKLIAQRHAGGIRATNRGKCQRIRNGIWSSGDARFCQQTMSEIRLLRSLSIAVIPSEMIHINSHSVAED